MLFRKCIDISRAMLRVGDPQNVRLDIFEHPFRDCFVAASSVTNPLAFLFADFVCLLQPLQNVIQLI